MDDFTSTGQGNFKVSYACFEVEYRPRIQPLSQVLGSTLARVTKILPEELNARVISSENHDAGESHAARSGKRLREEEFSYFE